MTRSLDMRYAGQSHELNVAAHGAQGLEEVVTRFHGVHERHYGYSMQGEEVAIVNYRLVATGVRPKPALESKESSSGDADAARKGERRVHFKDDWVTCRVYDRDLLKPGNVVHGPCVVEEWDTTTVVNDGYAGIVDGFGNLILAKGGGGR
jgi:N-methylhydantoinase A